MQPAAEALVLHPGEPTMSAPTYRPYDETVGRLGSSSCVAIGPNHVLSARHVSGPVGTDVIIGGITYKIAQYQYIGTADLRLCRITRDGQLANLTTWVPLYTSTNEESQTQLAIGGFGKGRGNTLYSKSKPYGYDWLGAEVQRWGANGVDSTEDDDELNGYISDIIIGDFDGVDEGGYVTWEAAAALHDSGGGWFIKDGGAWKVAGILRAVESHPDDPETTWFRNKDFPNMLDPDSFDAVRVSSYHSEISGAIAAPSAPGNVQAQTGSGHYEINLNWSASAGATSYTIYYQEMSAGPPFEPANDGAPASGTNVGNVTSAAITDLAGDVEYYFAVVAHKGIAVSDYSSQASAVTTSPVLADDFSDGIRGAMWRAIGSGSDSVQLSENNGRLELLAMADSAGEEAAYAANEWQIDSAEDFYIEISFHHDNTAGDSELFVSVDPDADGGTYLRLEAGNTGSQQYFSYHQAVDGTVTSFESKARASSDGVFQVFYDVSLDTLYVFEDLQWLWTFPALIGGEWGGEPVNVRIGGSCDGAALDSGRAYFDDFRLNVGVVLNWPPATDINHDGFVNTLDVELISDSWLAQGPGLDADVNGDLCVNLVDFARVARAWQ